MDAAGTSRWMKSAGAIEPARLLRVAVALGLLLLAIAGGLLVARRIAGALVTPPSAATFAMVGMLLAAAGLGFRRVLEDMPLAGQVRLALHALPGGVALLWLAALSLPDSGWALALLFAPVLFAEGWSWGRLVPAETPTDGDQPQAVASPAAVAPTQPDGVVPDIDEPVEREAETNLQQTRRRDGDAGDVLEGWVRVDFAAGQRHAAAHVAICPPMERNPTCYAELADGPDAAVKITQAMSFGVRLEVKLAEPAEEPTSVIVEYSILEHATGGE